MIWITVEKVIVIGVTKGQIQITAVMPCFSGHFGNFKTNPNGHEILRIIYRWKGMRVQFVQNFTKLNFNLFIKSYGHKTIQRSVLKTLKTLKSNLLKLDTYSKQPNQNYHLSKRRMRPSQVVNHRASTNVSEHPSGNELYHT